MQIFLLLYFLNDLPDQLDAGKGQAAVMAQGPVSSYQSIRLWLCFTTVDACALNTRTVRLNIKRSQLDRAAVYAKMWRRRGRTTIQIVWPPSPS